jgi:hypothetical protein
MAFMPLQQQQQQPRALTRRFGLTMTNHSLETRVALLEKQGLTTYDYTATLARVEKKLDDLKLSIDKKLITMSKDLKGALRDLGQNPVVHLVVIAFQLLEHCVQLFIDAQFQPIQFFLDSF